MNGRRACELRRPEHGHEAIGFDCRCSRVCDSGLSGPALAGRRRFRSGPAATHGTGGTPVPALVGPTSRATSTSSTAARASRSSRSGEPAPGGAIPEDFTSPTQPFSSLHARSTEEKAAIPLLTTSSCPRYRPVPGAAPTRAGDVRRTFYYVLAGWCSAHRIPGIGGPMTTKGARRLFSARRSTISCAPTT